MNPSLFQIDVDFPGDHQKVLWDDWAEGEEASHHVFQLNVCRYCGMSSESVWRTRGRRHKDLCLARTKIGRWASNIHKGKFPDPTGRIIVYVKKDLVEAWSANRTVPRRIAWIEVVDHPRNNAPAVLMLSGYPTDLRALEGR